MCSKDIIIRYDMKNLWYAAVAASAPLDGSSLLHFRTFVEKGLIKMLMIDT